MSYTFSTLNDRDLEELSRDLLSRSLSMRFQSFKPGTDEGVDLRHTSSDDDEDIIVQVKHYLNSGYAKLRNDLKKNELKKVIKLSPKRYILVTSVPLSNNNKEQLLADLHPYVLSTSDIIGQEDLNQMLLSHKDIEDSYFKLWISNTNVLKRILNNAVKGRSAFTETKILKKSELYVQNKAHNSAIKILNKWNFLLITGAPGVGKSTLADMLSCKYLAEDYELIYTSNITEAEESFLEGKKQLFYLDDFLGRITLNLFNSKNEDSQIVDFIDRVRNDPSKRAILTCRTVILNQAKKISEYLSHSKLDLASHEVRIQDYGKYHKARILYNHIYHSKLPDKFKDEFLRDRFYWRIINHNNYNPRLIEYLTDDDGQFIQLNSNFQSSVLHFFNNPEKIWEKSYKNQTSLQGKYFLGALFSLGSSDVKKSILKRAFDSRIEHEVNVHNFIRTHSLFEDCLLELNAAMIAIKQQIRDNRIIEWVGFINPSLEDYLEYYYAGDGLTEYLEMVKSFVFTDQFLTRINPDGKLESRKISIQNEDLDIIEGVFKDRIAKLSSIIGISGFQQILIILRLFKFSDYKSTIENFLQKFSNKEIEHPDFAAICELFTFLASNDPEMCKRFLCKYLLILSSNIRSPLHFGSIKGIFRENVEILDFLHHQKHAEEWYSKFQMNLNFAWEKYLDVYINTVGGIRSIYILEELQEAVAEMLEDVAKINEYLSLSPSPIFSTYTMDYEDILSSNNKADEERALLVEDKDHNEFGPMAINSMFNQIGFDELDDLPF